jgi:hypothetical protein
MNPGKDVFFDFVVMWFAWLFGQMAQSAQDIIQKRALEPQTLETLFALMTYAAYFMMMTKMVVDIYWPPGGAPAGGGAQFGPEEEQF